MDGNLARNVAPLIITAVWVPGDVEHSGDMG
jgi:hypothetical protein